MALSEIVAQWRELGPVSQEMVDRIYDYDEQKAKGDEGEGELDRYLGLGRTLFDAPREMQELGIDRIMVEEVGGLPYYLSLEYKTDRRATDTGNLFIETQIRERNGEITPGWLRRTIAQVLVFYLPQPRWIILLDANDLREWIFVHGKQLRHSKWIENRGGYAGRGLLLPMELGRRELRTWVDIDMSTRRVNGNG